MRQFAHLETILKQHAENVCAVIIEPFVQCAGSMRMYDPIYLTLLREACDKYCEQGAIHLIFYTHQKDLLVVICHFLQYLPPIKSTMHFMIITLAKKRSYIQIAIQAMR